MTPSKPYLIRALYDWLLDNEVTPYILVDASQEQVMIPTGIATDGKVVLNLAPSAIQKFELNNDYLSFSARFGGVAQDIYCPIVAVLAIYARENGEGMMFPDEAEQTDLMKGTSIKGEKGKSKKSSKPTLKIIK